MAGKRIVVKVGTSSLTAPDGSIQAEKIEKIVHEIAAVKQLGKDVILVSSGAIAAGFGRLAYPMRPSSIAAKQACAAVGQSLLMGEYATRLSSMGIVAAQILLTRDDFSDRRRYHNAFSALSLLLKRGAVPIINENDTVSIDEIKLGDNDMLSAQVASMMHADLLVMLTDTDALYTGDPRTDGTARPIAEVEHITDEILALGGNAGSSNATGGMATKVSAAKLAISAGVPVVICAAQQENVLIRLLDGEAIGTRFRAQEGSSMRVGQQWMAFYARPKGNIYIDDGAADAMLHHGGSLLPSGIVAADGDFVEGDIVCVYRAGSEEMLGRGKVNFSLTDLLNVLGLSGIDVCACLGVTRAEAIHRDDWVEG